MTIPHGTVAAAGANTTETRFCESDAVPAAIRSAGFRPAAGVALVRCRRALVEVRHHPPRGRVTCGAGRDGVDPGRTFEGADALLATDINFGNSMQHDIQNGLGMASVMWNFINDKEDLHVLTGETLGEFYHHLLGGTEGTEDRVHFITGARESWWFRSLFVGAVPETITFKTTNHIPTTALEMARRIQHGLVPSDPMLPCSVSSMAGFREWRAEFARPPGGPNNPDNPDNPNNPNGTLLYLQRTERRYFVFWDCAEAEGTRNANGTCSCRSVPEDEFVRRLEGLARRHGLGIEVFRHRNLKEDAAAMSRARVVIGPHGGAFDNTLFLDPALDPIVIETNLQQASYDCCRQQFNWQDPPRPCFAHLAASLGHRYRAYQPHVWRDYSVGDMRMSLEVNDYLEFVDETIRGTGDEALQTSAPFHPCVSLMV